jgi:LETM1 and EF-hand domain-containing protein 1, mitochondrial
LEVHNAEGAATNKQRLEVLEEQEELIEDENKQEKDVQETVGAVAKVKDDVDLDDKEEVRRAEADASAAEEARLAEESHSAAEGKKEDTKG